ncbi:hypothetical protein D3C72_2121840 [compost metagenome]
MFAHSISVSFIGGNQGNLFLHGNFIVDIVHACSSTCDKTEVGCQLKERLIYLKFGTDDHSGVVRNNLFGLCTVDIGSVIISDTCLRKFLQHNFVDVIDNQNISFHDYG